MSTSTHPIKSNSMSRRLPWLAASFLIAVLAFAPTASAFSGAVDLSATGVTAPQVQGAVSEDGDQVAVWSRSSDGGVTTKIELRHSLDPVQTISTGTGVVLTPAPGVAMDADGDALVVWLQYDTSTSCGGGPCLRVRARARSSAGALSPATPLFLSSPGQHATNPRVAMNAGGDAVVVWVRSDGTNKRLQVRARAADGTLSATQTLSFAGQDVYEGEGPAVAIDSAGNALAVWNRTDFRVFARARLASGTLGPVQTISTVGFPPSLAMEADGDALIVFGKLDATTSCGGGPCARVYSRPRAADGTLGTQQTLSPGGQHAELAQGSGNKPTPVDVDADGDAVVVWTRPDGTTNCGGGPCDRVQIRSRSSAGVLGSVTTLPANFQDSSFANVALDADGDGVVVWTRPDGGTGCGGGPCDRVNIMTRTAGGGLGSLEVPSVSGFNVSYPVIVEDSFGNAAAAWSADDGTDLRIQGAVCPACT